MALWKRSTLPDFLSFENRRGNMAEKTAAQEALGGDVSKFKLNHIMVSNESIRQIDRCLKSSAHGVEYVKMASVIYTKRKHDMPRFVETCREHNTIPYVGGGATERAQDANRLFDFTLEVQSYGIDTVEASNGDGQHGACSHIEDLKRLRKDFKRLIVEIGAKSTSIYRSVEAWKRDLDVALEHEADIVILEGIGSGRGGIYDRDGDGNTALVLDLMERAGNRADRLLLEAPHVQQCRFWIQELLGWRVRLGNLAMTPECLGAVDDLRLKAMLPDGMAAVLKNRALQEVFLAELRKIVEEEKLDLDRAMFQPGVHGVVHEVLEQPDWQDALRSHMKVYANIRTPHIFGDGRVTVIDATHLLHEFFQALYSQCGERRDDTGKK